jgi:hypothetical protein
MISIDRLIERHFELYGYNLMKRMDFVIVSLLCGNDYFPKLKYIDFSKLWMAYKKSVFPDETIVKSDLSLNIPVFINFMGRIFYEMPKQYANVSTEELFDDNISNYLFGLVWCLHLY